MSSVLKTVIVVVVRVAFVLFDFSLHILSPRRKQGLNIVSNKWNNLSTD
jgi:hypothetical protein